MIKKSIWMLLGALALAFVAISTIAVSVTARGAMVSSMPKNLRQTYFRHVFTPPEGFFSTYSAKVHSLDVLEEKVRDGQTEFADGTLLLPLLRGGMDAERHPIPWDAADILLLMNLQSNYEALFSRYKDDPSTIEAFRTHVLKFGENEPERYGAVVSTLKGMRETPAGFVASLELPAQE